jgi:hypothetical protein
MSHTSVRSIAIVAGVVVAAACASGGTSTPHTTSTPAPDAASAVTTAPAPRRSDRSHLNPDEIASARSTNMYDVISKLRPQWLVSHGVASRDSTINQVQVYVDGTKQEGGVQSLRQIEPMRVTGAQHIDGADASTRFGMGNGAGAILISTSRT